MADKDALVRVWRGQDRPLLLEGACNAPGAEACARKIGDFPSRFSGFDPPPRWNFENASLGARPVLRAVERQTGELGHGRWDMAQPGRVPGINATRPPLSLCASTGNPDTPP